MGLYITADDVKVRLVGKVRFTEDEEDENKMSMKLLGRLINEAEGAVEHDLSPRYEVPFKEQTAGTFKALPDRPTKETIRTLCEMMAVIRVLETDFGRGSSVDGEKYKKTQQDRYDAMVAKLLKKKTLDTEVSNQWMYPPLIQLKSAYFNTEADDGFGGMVLVTGQGDGDFPKKQINDPSETFWNGELDE